MKRRQSSILSFCKKKTNTGTQNEEPQQAELQDRDNEAGIAARFAETDAVSVGISSKSQQRLHSDESECGGTSSVCDISLNKSDSPVQSKLVQFPQTNGRRFSARYYDMYPWIEYSAANDAVYCFPCRHFQGNVVGSGEQYGEVTFVNRGTRKWKDLTNILHQHSVSQKHISSMIFWKDYNSMLKNTECSIASVLNTNRANVIEENRQQLPCC